MILCKRIKHEFKVNEIYQIEGVTMTVFLLMREKKFDFFLRQTIYKLSTFLPFSKVQNNSNINSKAENVIKSK